MFTSNVLFKIISLNSTLGMAELPKTVGYMTGDLTVDWSSINPMEGLHLQAPLIPTQTNKIIGPIVDPRHYNPDFTLDFRTWSEFRVRSNQNLNNNAPRLAKDIEKEFTLKVETYPPITSITMVNLSDYDLSEAEQTLLSLGKKFVTSPGEPNLGEIRSDEDTFHQACRRTYFFHKMTQNHGVTPPTSVAKQHYTRVYNPGHDNAFVKQKMKKHALFKTPSKWKPPPGPIPLESFIVINETELNRTIPRAPLRPNLSLELKAAKKSLLDNKGIVIKQADKGGAMVVWG